MLIYIWYEIRIQLYSFTYSFIDSTIFLPWGVMASLNWLQTHSLISGLLILYDSILTNKNLSSRQSITRWLHAQWAFAGRQDWAGHCICCTEPAWESCLLLAPWRVDPGGGRSPGSASQSLLRAQWGLPKGPQLCSVRPAWGSQLCVGRSAWRF